MAVAITSHDIFASILLTRAFSFFLLNKKHVKEHFLISGMAPEGKGIHDRTKLSTDTRGHRRGASVKLCVYVGGGGEKRRESWRKGKELYLS